MNEEEKQRRLEQEANIFKIKQQKMFNQAQDIEKYGSVAKAKLYGNRNRGISAQNALAGAGVAGASAAIKGAIAKEATKEVGKQAAKEGGKQAAKAGAGAGMSAGAGMGLSIGAGVVKDNITRGGTTTSSGEGALGGAAEGAALGAQLGGAKGAAVGAAVGAVKGVLSARAARKQQARQAEAQHQTRLANIEGEKTQRMQNALQGLQNAFGQTLNSIG